MISLPRDETHKSLFALLSTGMIEYLDLPPKVRPEAKKKAAPVQMAAAPAPELPLIILPPPPTEAEATAQATEHRPRRQSGGHADRDLNDPLPTDETHDVAGARPERHSNSHLTHAAAHRETHYRIQPHRAEYQRYDTKDHEHRSGMRMGHCVRASCSCIVVIA